jgi:hypothetical protein
VTAADVQTLVIGALQGLAVTTAFVLVLWVGFCVVFGFPKLRPTSRQSMVVKSLDEMVGERVKYLPPDAPRGPIDQLRAHARGTPSGG